MSGNIGEICWDAYDETTYAKRVQAGTITKILLCVIQIDLLLVVDALVRVLMVLQIQFSVGVLREVVFLRRINTRGYGLFETSIKNYSIYPKTRSPCRISSVKKASSASMTFLGMDS